LEQSNIFNLDPSQKRKRNQLELEIRDLEKKKKQRNNEISDLEIKFDQENRIKIQTQKNRYERPIELLKIEIDSKDKSIKDIDEKSKNSGQTDMTPISNAEKDYFNYVINFINVATSGKDSKNIIQRMFENDAIVRIYNDSNGQIKNLKKIPFFKKQDESFFNFFQRGGANSLSEPFTETVKKYMLNIKKVNTFYVDAYFNYLARVNKEFNIYIQQLFLRLDSAMKTEVDHTNDLCKKLQYMNNRLKIIIAKIKDSESSTSLINNSDYTKNLYPYTDFILAYFMILVYFINLLIIKILGCSDSKGSSGGGETNDNNKLDINEVYYNGIKIYVRKANKNSISGMIKRIKNRPKSSFTTSETQTNEHESSFTTSETQTNKHESSSTTLELELSIKKKKIKNEIKLSNYRNNKNPLYKIVNNLKVEQLNELLKIENSKELINKIRINKKMN
jgi:hypothetical protein